MAKFKTKQGRPKVVVNTSALPDIIFMLLFFFMVVTVLRQQRMLLKIEIPKASEVQKLKHRSLVHHLYIGKPSVQKEENRSRIQINDAFVEIDQVKEAVENMVLQAPESKRGLVTTALKVDKDTEMGLVGDVKMEIRKAQQYKLSYEAIEGTVAFK